VEFCAQTLQLVWGGRTPALRVPATLAALDAAERSGHLPAATVGALKDAYVFLRTVEHRLQMVADRQTHALPTRLPELEIFSRFLGYADAAAFAATALRHMNAVHAVFASMFTALPEPPDEAPVAASAAAASDLRSDIVAGWQAGRPRAFRTARSKTLLAALIPAIEAAVARQTGPDAALVRLDGFFHALPAGVQILSMLTHNPALLDRLADVAGAAPWLADHLAEVPAALEGLAAPQSFADDPAALLDALLRDARGVDDALSIASRLVRAEEFAAAAAEFFGRIDADEAGRRRTALADAVIGVFLRRVMAEHAGRYGKVSGGGMVVVALGKLGSGDMMAGSDLDLMLVYDHPAAAESGGPRRLPASQYFARAAQAVVAALTVPTRHGPLYQVDMRLRPSGNKGPVAVSRAAFEQYHRESAWTWERLALTRARVVAGPAALRRRVAAAITAALRQNDGRVRRDTAEMRARLLRDLPPRGVWDARLRSGGLMEVEFIAQALMLEHAARPRVLAPRTRDGFANLARAGVLPAPEAAMLIAADRFWRTLQGLTRIALGRQVPASLPAPLLEKILQATGAITDEKAPAAGTDEASLRGAADIVARDVRAAFVRHVGEIGTP
jgi:glutamate-ammonia-ligase adenylyltransferase